MDLRFATEVNHLHIQHLYPVYQFQVEVDAHHSRNVQTFDFSLEKLENTIQFRISEFDDQSRMFICTIDNSIYQNIKTEQALQVNFQGFVDHLIKILDSCRKGGLFSTLIQSQNCWALQFYEKHSLKNLVHLFLPMQEAPSTITMYHLNRSLTNFKNELSVVLNQNITLQTDMKKRDLHIQELSSENLCLKDKIADAESMVLHRNTEEIKRLNQEIKHIETTKEYEENRLKTVIKTLKMKVDHLASENCLFNEKLKLGSNECSSLQNELDNMKKKMKTTTTESDRLKSNLSQLDCKDKLQQAKIDEQSQRIVELLGDLRSANKEKSNFQAELDAEKQACHTKKRALQIATDGLAKNQEIITQQEKKTETLRKSIKWRTLVILRMNSKN